MARTVKGHLAAHHAKSASFDMSVGTELEKLRKCFEALETNLDGDDAVKKSFRDAKDSVGRLSAAFNAHARYHRDMGKDVEKGADIDDLDKLAPSGVSAIIDPGKAPAANLRMVPRSGQPSGPAGEMPKVDMRFEHLVKVDD
jgi:hypothetical protein